jgi:hypothetical protein
MATRSQDVCLTFRPDAAALAAWRRVMVTQGGTQNEVFRRVAHRLDDAIRAQLDAEALPLYEAGQLDRTAWGAAAVRYHLRKRAVAPAPVEPIA